MLEITSKDHLDQVTASEKVLVIDLWAPWCGPCTGFAPKFEELASAYPSYTFAKANVDQVPDIAKAFGVRGIPTVVALKDGQVAFTVAGNVAAVTAKLNAL